MKTTTLLLAFMLLVCITKSNAQIQSQPNKEDQPNSTHSLIAEVLKKKDCEYLMRDKNGKVFTGVDAPCHLHAGDYFKGNAILEVIHQAPKRNYNQWHPNPIYIRKDSLIYTKYQCWGTTAKGLRCRRSVKCDHCYCVQHEKQKLPEVD